MKKSNSFVLFTVLFVLIIFFSNTHVKAQYRAAKGDTVWVLLNNIKPDKKQQFEKFMHETFWQKSASLDTDDQQVFKHTRVLHPVEMNEDGTYTYIFLMDPVITNKSYNILYYLKKMYGEEEANKYYKMFEECYANPQTGYSVIQSYVQDSNVREAIESGDNEFMESFKHGNAAAIAALYTEEGQLLPPNSDFIKGKKAIETFWKGAMEMGIKSAKLEIVEVGGLGETAYEVGKYTLFADNENILDSGKYVVIWKQTDGQWKMHRDIWNSLMPASKQE